MRKIVIFSLVLCLTFFMFTGCAEQENSPISVLLENAEFSQTLIFTFEKTVFDDTKFMFEVYDSDEYIDGEEPARYYIIHISCPSLLDYTPQIIKIPSTETWTEEYDAKRENYIDLVDIDFDGYADISVEFSRGNVNSTTLFYRWNPIIGAFEEEEFFTMLECGYKLFPDTKQIISWGRGSASSYYFTVHQLDVEQHQYETIREGSIEYITNENGERDIKVQIGDYEEVFLNGEGYDEETFYNYLRFGVGHPN